MSWIFLGVEVVEALHHQQIVRFGGSHGLRDAGLLESAVLRAEQRAHYDSRATVAAVAASLGWGLIKNHAFVDGNKRIGLVSLVSFLKLNGYALPVATEEQIAVVWKAAAGEITEDEFSAWVEHNVAPLDK
ncbi:MAG TPA: type II toxin-antitoxin system death-on-curing family toxin [Granulicella sp.]|jgi:death-on-curing protein